MIQKSEDAITSINEPKTLMDTSILRIQINSEPLTARDLSIVIPAITDFYTRCWLIQQRRFADLIDYALTRHPRFIKEADLQVGLMTHNSPATIDFIVNAGKIIGGAASLGAILKSVIDAVIQTRIRFDAVKMKAQDEAEKRRLENKLTENEYIKQRIQMLREINEILDKDQRETFVQLLMPPVLQLSSVKGIETALLPAQSNEEIKGSSEMK